MNTRISRQVVFTFTVLLTTMWLPLTTFANDILTVTSNPETTTENHSFGFSEADPSEHLFVDVAAVWQLLQQQTPTGFAETDPAYNRTRDDWVLSSGDIHGK